MLPSTWISSVRDRLAGSRFLAASILLHIVLVIAVGTSVLFQFDEQPPDLIAYESFVQPGQEIQRQLPVPPPHHRTEDLVRQTAPSPSTGETSVFEHLLRNSQPSNLNLSVPDLPMAAPQNNAILEGVPRDFSIPNAVPSQLTKDDLARIHEFTNWSPDTSIGKPVTQRRFVFKAYLGRYADGNWQSTVKIRDGKVAAGSLPNLLYLMSKWSDDRIQTNERNVEAIALDSSALLNDRPPFVFLTGTRDFQLTAAEIENLRHYLRSGGAVWGDSSVPGQRSAFDIAFRREMKKVLGGGAADFEPLASDHAIFSRGYFPHLDAAPAGLNNYRESVDVLRWGGEIAVIHTRNDYGNMWRVGLDEKGAVDLSKTQKGEFVATDPAIWNHRGAYLRNLEPASVRKSFEFGINVVVHLLTRWETRTAGSQQL